jgi:peptidoglycan/xylan/chitin deacetylase (PgdA/CDA1 family)
VLARSINLTFHGVGVPDRHLDPGEEGVWIGRDQLLSLLDRAASRDDVVLTFDDGNASDLLEGLPALRERGLTAKFFVVAGRLGARGYLDADGVRELAAAGMEIGCHGMHHRAWRGLRKPALQEELVDARLMLEGILGRPVTGAACPFGSYDRRVLHALRRAGYLRVYTSDRGAAPPDAWLQPRNTVGPRDDEHLLELVPVGDGFKRRAKLAVKRWR